MTNVAMNTEQFTIKQADPELPEVVKRASQNHGGMTVPADFFAQFEQKMNAVIDTEVLASQPAIEPAAAKRTTTMTRRWAGIAAAVALVVAVTAAIQINWSAPDTPPEPEVMAETITSDYDDQSAEEQYYATLSDYEVYDIIYGI